MGSMLSNGPGVIRCTTVPASSSTISSIRTGIVYRSAEPVLVPETAAERFGTVDDVVYQLA
jgi:hypothetical protein